MKLSLNIFKLPSAATVAQQQREDAERLALEHEAAGEHHIALAAMYRARVARLADEKAGA